MGGFLEVGVEGAIAEGGWVLRVATSDKVKENGVKGPDFIEQGRIGAVVGRSSAMAF